MEHDFNERLAWSERPEHTQFWRAGYMRAFPGFMNMMAVVGKSESQRMGIDRIVHLADGTTLRIEEKRRGEYYPDILLEVESSDRTGAVGWIEKNLAIDFLAYGFRDVPLIYLFPWAELRHAWEKNKRVWTELAKERFGGFDRIPVKNHGYVTTCIAVPTPVLKAEIEASALALHPIVIIGREPGSSPIVGAPELTLTPPVEGRSAKEIIASVLAEVPESRSNVNRLLGEFWQRKGLPLTPELVAMLSVLTPAETIRRQSRKIMNEEGLYRK